MNAHDETSTAAFDAAIRAQHAAALEQVSPQVRARLAQRRHAAVRGTPRRQGHGLRYAVAGFGALCVLAIGLRIGAPPSPRAVAAPAVAGAAPAATMLDEDPEFYAWLASNDAQLATLE